MALYKYAELLDKFEETKRLRIKKEFDVVALTPLQRDFYDTRFLSLQTPRSRTVRHTPGLQFIREPV